MRRSSSNSFKSVFSITLILVGLILLALLLTGDKLFSSLEGTLLDMDLRQIAIVADSPLRSASADRHTTYVPAAARQENIRGEVDFVGRDHIEVFGMDFEVTSRTIFKGFNSLNDLSEGKKVEIEFSREGGRRKALRIELESGLFS